MPFEAIPIKGPEHWGVNSRRDNRTPEDVASDIERIYTQVDEAKGRIVGSHTLAFLDGNLAHDPKRKQEYLFLVAELPEGETILP